MSLFSRACLVRNLHLAKAIYNDKNSFVSFYDQDVSFVAACRFGHIETAKWLYSLG